MKKIVSLLLLIMLATVVPTFVLGDEPIPLIFGSAVTEDSISGYPAKYFMDRVDELIPGRIDWQAYWNNSIGNEEEVMRGIQMGSIDCVMQTNSAINMVAEYTPYSDLDSVPFLFPSMQCLSDCLSDWLFEEMKPIYYERGYQSLFFNPAAGIEIGTNVGECYTPESLAHQKIRTWSNDFIARTLAAFKCQPTAVAFNECYSALSQGTVDGLITSDQQFPTQKFTEVCKYVTHAGIGYCTFIFWMNTDKWESLPEDVQAAFLTAAEDAQKFSLEVNMLRSTGELWEQMAAEGMTICEWDDDAKASALKMLEKDYVYFKEKTGDELWNKTQDYIAKWKEEHAE